MPETEHKQGLQPGLDQKPLARAVEALARGGLVAFPTETWYGLAVDPFNPQALARLFAVKKRPAIKPVLVLIAHRRELGRLVRSVPPLYYGLMERFWPGPLTLVFPARNDLPDQLTAGSGTIAVRYSPHPLALALIDHFGGPVTATSANKSGQPPCASADEVCQALGTAPDVVLDGGVTRGGKGSTIVCCRQDRLVCLRDGQLDFATVLDQVDQQ